MNQLHVTPFLAATLLLAGTASPARAQSAPRLFVGGSLGSFSVDADHVEGRSAATGIVAGVALSRIIDAEIEMVFPASTVTRSLTGISTSFAPSGSSREEIERLGVVTRFDRSREVTVNLSGVIIIHPPVTSRVTPGLIVGVTNQRARDRTFYDPISIPEGVDPHHPAVVAHEEVHIRNYGALTFGGNLSIAVSKRLYVVPDVRYDYGSIGDEINNALRTSVKVVWRW
jgi:hypothetical protein